MAARKLGWLCSIFTFFGCCRQGTVLQSDLIFCCKPWKTNLMIPFLCYCCSSSSSCVHMLVSCICSSSLYSLKFSEAIHDLMSCYCKWFFYRMCLWMQNERPVFPAKIHIGIRFSHNCLTGLGVLVPGHFASSPLGVKPRVVDVTSWLVFSIGSGMVKLCPEGCTVVRFQKGENSGIGKLSPSLCLIVAGRQNNILLVVLSFSNSNWWSLVPSLF